MKLCNYTELFWLGDSIGTFGPRIKLPPAHLSIIQGGGFTLSISIAEHQAGKLWIPIFSLWFDSTGNRTQV